MATAIRIISRCTASGVRAAEIAGTAARVRGYDEPRALQAPHGDCNRKRWTTYAVEDRPTAEDIDALGVDEALITTTVDVRDYATLKRDALAAHESQVGPESFFLAMPEEAFREAFGLEFFIHRGAPAGTAETWLFDDELSRLLRRPSRSPRARRGSRRRARRRRAPARGTR